MAVRPIANASFEDGTSAGWDIPGGIAYVVGSQDDTPFGVMALRFTTGSPGVFRIHSSAYVPVVEGKVIKASCNYTQGPASAWKNTGQVILTWYDASNNSISESPGTLIYATGANGSNQAQGFALSAVTGTAPAGAVSVRIGLLVNKNNNDWCSVDNFVWDYETAPDNARITSPTNAGIYQQGSTTPFRAEFILPAGVTVTTMKYVVTDILAATVAAELVPSTMASPWAVNDTSLPAAEYKVAAQFTLNSNEVITTAEVVFKVGNPPPPDTREYRASNSGTQLVMDNFGGIASAIPSTALVTGAELVVDYELAVLSRNIDRDLAPSAADPDTVFSVVNSGILEATMLNKDGAVYEVIGAPMTTDIAILRSDFVLQEEGISEENKWSVFESTTSFQAVVGSDDTLFGSGVMSVADFLVASIGLRFSTVAGTIPSTSLSGNAVVRIKFNTIRLRVYFDAGSVEYYFQFDDNVIKGTLVSANVLDGDLKNGDASGVLQFAPDLDLSAAGTYNGVLDNWTIHSNTPPTEANLIGVVSEDMQYNALPSYAALAEARTRTEIITANFYGDERLNSMYGVNGVDRAFSYNGENFYKIYTQPEADKDLPRHVAYHHSHLALGYREGRVDISVVGEPYNFSGVDGASSWGIGDSVTGLLRLSGTLLGIFGSNSVTGLSGTTVDNFATQTISAKMGAIEYTITDMGYPVYANAYGIYTLSQVQQYGDYLGTPLSQDISPWLRPRLVRKDTSAKEVVVAWPVRSKNQYRLAFADGYVLTMTMNNGQQSAPTFSTQKYFYDTQVPEEVTDNEYMYAGKAIVPSAISSQLDDGGEERIHIANAQVIVKGSPAPDPGEEVQYKFMTYTSPNGTLLNAEIMGAEMELVLEFTSDGSVWLLSNMLDTFLEPNYINDMTTFAVDGVEIFSKADGGDLRGHDVGISRRGGDPLEVFRREGRFNEGEITPVTTGLVSVSKSPTSMSLIVRVPAEELLNTLIYRVKLSHPNYAESIWAIGEFDTVELET